MGLEQDLTEGPSELSEHVAGRNVLEHLAGQRVAIGVKAARRQPHQRVAGLDRLAVRARLDQTDYETSEVVIPQRVDTGHLRGLAAEQRTARSTACGGHAFDELREDIRVQPPRREVVEEEQRTRPCRRDVVDAVVDDVDADAAMRSRGDRDLDLRPHPIRARSQVAAARQRIQARERADA